MKQKVFMSWKWVDDQIDELAKRLKNKKLSTFLVSLEEVSYLIMLSHKLNVPYLPFDSVKKNTVNKTL